MSVLRNVTDNPRSATVMSTGPRYLRPHRLLAGQGARTPSTGGKSGSRCAWASNLSPHNAVARISADLHLAQVCSTRPIHRPMISVLGQEDAQVNASTGGS